MTEKVINLNANTIDDDWTYYGFMYGHQGHIGLPKDWEILSIHVSLKDHQLNSHYLRKDIDNSQIIMSLDEPSVLMCCTIREDRFEYSKVVYEGKEVNDVMVSIYYV